MSEPPMSFAVSLETTNCPLCGDDRSCVLLTSRDLHHECRMEFTVVRCRGCRHAFLNPRPTRECIGLFYPSDYGPFRQVGKSNQQTIFGRPKLQAESSASPSPKGHSKWSPRSWPWLRRLVLWWIDSRATLIPKSPFEFQSPRRALELGCARGVFLQQLRDQGWECVGVEPSAEVAGRTKACGFDVRIGMLEAVMHDDPETFAPESFDAVFAWMVVEHLHDPVGTLRIAKALLKRNGTLTFSVPNFGCWERSVFGRLWHALDLPRHLQHFTVNSLSQLLQLSGFELVELIQQRSVLSLVGSVGLFFRSRLPRWSLGERLIRWTDNPSALGLCLLAPLARVLSAVRQASSLTIVARRIDEQNAGSTG